MRVVKTIRELNQLVADQKKNQKIIGLVPTMGALHQGHLSLVTQASLQCDFIVVSICLAISALYELIEWWAAIAQGASAEAFLGTQGYEWDAQSDMFIALIGAIVSLLLLSGFHNKFLYRKIGFQNNGPGVLVAKKLSA